MWYTQRRCTVPAVMWNTCSIAVAMPGSPSVKMTVGAERCLANCSNANTKASFGSPS
jgi:hypothetical protein